MQVIKSISEWQALRKQVQKTIGFVATMGCLHEGHASLLEKSKKENAITVLSIFVNPTQFNQQSDFTNYPKTEERDLAMAKSLAVDYVFMPTVQEIYPESNAIFVDTASPISQIMEGKHRPGHFSGMLTIVLKLLLLIKPTRAYFGEKDYQQYELVKKLALNFFLECEIIPCTTLRESSGLALSSRNQRLSPAAREIAVQFAQLFHQYPKNSKENILDKLYNLNVTVDYLQQYQDRVFIAAWIDGIRLIDNFQVEEHV